ncbi:dienelactone hydrolase family protein [Psychrobacillus psychrodurans]|uniref:Dienelactone hydrolase family protein n=1 Tax=Psychrobacillus psychrodurans TaxID=126157 RepID=A0A9X3L9G3_9BACI|nr:dienelactone hydrolase family protein [Psychrobacillus psychrodurans]MCK1996952.1 dienelactone hydrolase family protein [Psychrobacillus psychrodurans]MCZ8533827.1 dienelactone hydrolase family protein [Psychrobacillus psychrodurans]MCZ8538720.1 dienelactone hydrolase family protein [Psychrobacillus psychrodurans]SFM20584.1 phospholipase/carboxylesterase [Psychrobacillus psychrodurans]
MKSPFTFNHTAPINTSKKQPAIFLLHGMGSNEADLPQLVRDFENTHHIFSLRGPIVQKPGYSFFEIEEIGKPIRDIFDKIVTHIQAFIREAIVEYNLNPDNITILGFSQGAILAQTVALTMGNEISKVVALSGYIPEFVKTEYSKRDVNHLSIFISHGNYDYVIPSQWGIESNDYFEAMGAKVTFKSYNDGHGVTPENHQDLVEFLNKN